MLRIAVSLIALSIPALAVAQTPPATTAPAAQAAPQAKPVAKKPATKSKAAAKPAEPASTGPCGIGVIAATQDPFVVEKIGLTVFGNEYAEVPVSWDLDDLRVYDGATFALIKEAAALMTEDTFTERVMHNPLGGPSMQVDRAMFPERPADAVNNAALRDGVRTMLTKSLDKTQPALLQRPSPSR